MLPPDDPRRVDLAARATVDPSGTIGRVAEAHCRERGPREGPQPMAFRLTISFSMSIITKTRATAAAACWVVVHRGQRLRPDEQVAARPAEEEESRSIRDPRARYSVPRTRRRGSSTRRRLEGGPVTATTRCPRRRNMRTSAAKRASSGPHAEGLDDAVSGVDSLRTLEPPRPSLARAAGALELAADRTGNSTSGTRSGRRAEPPRDDEDMTSRRHGERGTASAGSSGDLLESDVPRVPATSGPLSKRSIEPRRLTQDALEVTRRSWIVRNPTHLSQYSAK